MSTALHSFIDIFDTEFGEGQDPKRRTSMITRF